MRLVAGRDLQGRRSRPRRNPARRTSRARRATMRSRASRNGRRSAWTCGAHQGEAAGMGGVPVLWPANAATRLQDQYVRRIRGSGPLRGARTQARERRGTREGHRQLAPQRQCRRHRRQALRRPHRREHPSRQGHAGDPARHAPDLRRREGLASATGPPSRSSAPSSRTASTVPLPGRRRLPLHEPGELRPGRACRRTSSATRRPTCRRRWR